MKSNIRPSFTIGIEEEYQTIDPETRDLRSHIDAEILEKGKMILEERVKPEMHQSVVGDRHRHLQEHPGGARGGPRDPPQIITPGARERPAARRRRHASVRRLARAGDLSRRALPHDRGGPEDGGARQPDLRPARAHRRRGSRNRHPADERGALLPAAHAGALHQLAVLAGHGYGPEVVSLQGLRQISAHQHPGYFPSWGGIREFRQPADQHQLHRQRQEDLVGHPAASVLPHARIPRLRYARCGSTRPSPSRR